MDTLTMLKPTDIRPTAAFVLFYIPIKSGDVILEKHLTDLPLGTQFDVICTPSYPGTSAAQGWRKCRYTVKSVHDKHRGDMRVYEQSNRRELTAKEIVYYEALIREG